MRERLLEKYKQEMERVYFEATREMIEIFDGLTKENQLRFIAELQLRIKKK